MADKQQQEAPDLGTPELVQHHEVADGPRVVKDSKGRATKTTGRRVLTQTPLDRYWRRKEITYDEYDAGRRLHADWYFAVSQPRVTASYNNEIRLRKPSTAADDREDARYRYTAAVQHVGQVLNPIIIHVACMEGSAAEWAAGQGCPPNHGLPLLRAALRQLALYYGRGGKT